MDTSEALIESGVSARVIPEITWGQLADLNYTNQTNIQNKLQGFNTNQGTEQKVTTTEEVVEEETVEEPRYSDDVIPVKTEEFTYTFEDGVTTTKYRAKTYLDGSADFEQWDEGTEMWGPASKKLNIKAGENITALEVLDALNPGDTVTSDKVNDYKTIMNPKMWDRLTQSQQERIDPGRTVEGYPLNDELFADLLKNNFEDIPPGIINYIRDKIIRGDSLTPQEDVIVEAWEIQNDQDLVLDHEISSIKAATEKNEEGLQAESDNENVIVKIEAKKKEIEEFKIKLENEFRAQIKEANPSISKGKLNLQVEDMMDVSEELKKLNSELKTLQSKIGYKILDNFDSRDSENIDKFIEWAQENLPDFINIEDIDALAARLKANGVTVGAFVMELSKIAGGMDIIGKIYTGKQSPYRYHEAFHGVFRMLMSEEEIKKYLAIAKVDVKKQMRSKNGYEIIPGTFVKTIEQARAVMKSLSKSYAVLDNKTLDERIYEEYLADEFEKFKTSPRSSKVNSEVKSLFTRIIEWIKNVFLSYNRSELDGLFRNIDTGKYKNSGVVSNRFTDSVLTDTTIIEEGMAPSNVALKAIRKGDPIATVRPTIENGRVVPDGKTIYINNYFTQNETDGIVAQIGANYINRVDDLINDPEFTGEYNPDALLEETINNYINDYNPARVYIKEDGTEEYFYADNDNWNSFKHRLKERHNSLVKYKDDVITAVSEYLSLFDMDVTSELEILEKTDMSADGSVKTTEQYEAAANEIGGFKSLSKGVRKFLATTTKQIEDEFTGELVSVPVNYIL